jgi:outer membrane protein assembly factor BamA
MMPSLRPLIVAMMLLVWVAPAMAIADEGGPVIQGIVISGLKYTRPRTVLRELPFRKGDVWTDRDAPEAERRLRNLGLFSDVHVSPPDANGQVHILVQGRWPVWLLPTISRHDNGDTTGGATFTDYNLWGLRHKLQLDYRKDTGKNFSGGSSNSSYQGSYLWRRIDDSKWSLDLHGSRGRQIFNTYLNGAVQSQYQNNADSFGLSLRYGLGPVPDEGSSVFLGFDDIKSTYTLFNGPPQPDVQNQHRRSLTMGIDYQWLDDHITWLSGQRAGYSLSVADKALGSSIQVYRQTAYYRNYYDLGGQKTLNFRLDGGVATGDVLRDGLFDIGGSNGVRGYYPGELQGSSYLEGSIESRVPVEFNSNLQWVAFTDVGYVTHKGQTTTISPFAVGTGMGMRWTLRWLVNGIIRVDGAYGWATHKWRAYLQTGQAF